MPQVADSYQFQAAIQSKGKQRNNDGWTLTVDWKLPGSKFELVLYGQDWDDIEGWNVGDCPLISINRGNLKDGKEGKYTSDYFWDLADISAGESRTEPQKVIRTQGAASPSNSDRDQGDINQRIAWNSAVNNAVHLHGPVPGDGEGVSWGAIE